MTWFTPESFEEVVTRFEPALKEALLYHLEDRKQAERVTAATLEQAKRVWEASEGEVNVLEMLASTAAFQCGMLPPRFLFQKRVVPDEAQLFRYLETYRFEKVVEEKTAQIERMKGDLREGGNAHLEREILRQEADLEQMVEQFWNSRLPLGNDEDEDANGPVPCAVAGPPPQRGPAQGRTFQDALEPPRNP